MSVACSPEHTPAVALVVMHARLAAQQVGRSEYVANQAWTCLLPCLLACVQVEYICLKGTSKESPAVCKYTGNRYAAIMWLWRSL